MNFILRWHGFWTFSYSLNRIAEALFSRQSSPRQRAPPKPCIFCLQSALALPHGEAGLMLKKSAEKHTVNLLSGYCRCCGVVVKLEDLSWSDMALDVGGWSWVGKRDLLNLIAPTQAEVFNWFLFNRRRREELAKLEHGGVFNFCFSCRLTIFWYLYFLI